MEEENTITLEEAEANIDSAAAAVEAEKKDVTLAEMVLELKMDALLRAEADLVDIEGDRTGWINSQEWAEDATDITKITAWQDAVAAAEVKITNLQSSLETAAINVSVQKGEVVDAQAAYEGYKAVIAAAAEAAAAEVAAVDNRIAGAVVEAMKAAGHDFEHTCEPCECEPMSADAIADALVAKFLGSGGELFDAAIQSVSSKLEELEESSVLLRLFTKAVGFFI